MIFAFAFDPIFIYIALALSGLILVARLLIGWMARSQLRLLALPPLDPGFAGRRPRCPDPSRVPRPTLRSCQRVSARQG